MKTCYVMVGLPATGKSTLVNKMREMDSDAFVYSTDNFIEDAAKHFGKTYNEMFEDNIKPATAAMEEMLTTAMKYNQDVIWDQTNTGVKKRTKIINRMKQAGYRVECHFICPPGASQISDQVEWKNRLNGRPGKTIPTNVIASMTENLVEPTLDEGFDEVVVYNMYGIVLK